MELLGLFGISGNIQTVKKLSEECYNQVVRTQDTSPLQGFHKVIYSELIKYHAIAIKDLFVFCTGSKK